ncbi:hypothetical protein JTB14_014446 [Gonioctena quinquepunctata]|nr:hypothetical protein JTB14_014446 [Gonioctena quinquepunctata]
MKLLELEHQLKEAKMIAQEEIRSRSEKRELLSKLPSTTEDYEEVVSEWVNNLLAEYTYEEPTFFEKGTMSEIKLFCETILNVIKSLLTL